MENSLVLTLVLAGLTCISCSLQVVRVAPPITPQFAPTTSSPASPDIIITLEDNSKSFVLHPNEHFLVKLGEGNYSVSSSDESVISRVPNISVIRGAQGVYEARKLGQATLTGAVGPDCSPIQVCPQYLRLVLSVTLVVQK